MCIQHFLKSQKLVSHVCQLLKTDKNKWIYSTLSFQDLKNAKIYVVLYPSWYDISELTFPNMFSLIMIANYKEFTEPRISRCEVYSIGVCNAHWFFHVVFVDCLSCGRFNVLSWHCKWPLVESLVVHSILSLWNDHQIGDFSRYIKLQL